MGLLSFLFDTSDTVTIQVQITREQYESLEFLINVAKKKKTDFDYNKLFSRLLGDFLDKNLGNVVDRMVKTDGSTGQKKLTRR